MGRRSIEAESDTAGVRIVIDRRDKRKPLLSILRSIRSIFAEPLRALPRYVWNKSSINGRKRLGWGPGENSSDGVAAINGQGSTDENIGNPGAQINGDSRAFIRATKRTDSGTG